MGIIGTLSMAHKVYSALWLGEPKYTPGSRIRGRLPKWHRHRQVHAKVASPNRQPLDFWAPKDPALDSDCNSDSECECIAPNSGNFDGRIKRSGRCTNVESLASVKQSTKDLLQLVNCWWPLNICHEMRQRLHKIVKHSAEIKVLWPSRTNSSRISSL
ncbi:hypothetical protein M5D96_013367 [Drosophila gunungcola]|uniref:Uncharacterized protein n=1 Tax=Drosophila gunungcola TaxID=103775 RepID=A0A9P9YBG6_9MUSC|nr:hypothetical protein M5D96_013367 [Drosophila gunungcola]